MDAESMYQVLRHGTADERIAFGRSLPPDPMRDLAIGLLGADLPGMVVVSLGPVAIAYCSGRNPEVGAELAFALHRRAVELFQGTPGHGLIPTTLSGLADSYVRASNLLGRSAEVLTFADRYIPFYEQIGETVNLPSLKLGRVEALLNLDRLDDADAALSDPTLSGNPASDIELARLRGRLRQLRASITKDRSQAAPAPVSLSDDALAAALAVIARNAPGLPTDANVQQLVGRLAGSSHLDPNDPGDYAQLLDLLKTGEGVLRRGGEGAGGDSQLTVRARIREATSIFKLQDQPSPEMLRRALAALEASLDSATRMDVVELQNDALWGIYLCHTRLQEPSDAADAALRLRENLERARGSIADVTQRGGAFSQYPYLFAALCEKLHAAGRAPELLEAIEASKGRGVADLLTARAGQAVSDASIYGAAARVPDLCRTHGFHYLTYFVDDDRTYAVLVTRHGDIRALPPAPLPRADIRAAATPVTPQGAARLAALVEPLASLIDERVILPGEHLCVAPDDDLANVPFAFLPLRGAPLVESLSTSRIHNAFHLGHLLDEPARRPDRYLGVVVPARGNVGQPNWAEMEASLHRPIDRLAKELAENGDTYEGATVSVGLLARRDMTHRAVHFSTHGMFPRTDQSRAPYEHSGLVLTDGKLLPDLKAIDMRSVLTPRAVLERKLDLSGSHVSMMACVSGLSREGIGGDALGLEWAMIQAGAASVVSTHWDISARQAAAFLDAFYEQWLGHGSSRAAAMAAATAKLRAGGGRAADPTSWAAFSLTGDWR